jgi:hypothetical protein
MAIDISCPECGESENLSGARSGDAVSMNCEECGAAWERRLTKRCATCGSEDLQTVPLAIVERSRGTQLSVVGTRSVDLCSVCDVAVLRHYHDHRPNPLMPTDLPTVGEEHLNG